MGVEKKQHTHLSSGQNGCLFSEKRLFLKNKALLWRKV
jgi:hypothetical protein